MVLVGDNLIRRSIKVLKEKRKEVMAYGNDTEDGQWHSLILYILHGLSSVSN